MITRPFTAADVNLVRNSFCRGVLQTQSCSGVGWNFMRDMVDRVIVDDYWTCLAYVDEAVEDEVISWIAFNAKDRKVFWLSTKPRYYKSGFGWELAKKCISPGLVYFPFTLDHWQNAVCRRMGYQLEIRPYLALE
jgi:hypothetical protein